MPSLHESAGGIDGAKNFNLGPECSDALFLPHPLLLCLFVALEPMAFG